MIWHGVLPQIGSLNSESRDDIVSMNFQVQSMKFDLNKECKIFKQFLVL